MAGDVDSVDVTGQNQDAGGGGSYSEASGRVTEKVMSCMFQKTDPSISYTLTEVDIARICYQILKIPEGRLKGYDESAFRRLRIYVDPSLNLEEIMTSTAKFVRNGLRLEPMKKATTEFWIKINWIPYEEEYVQPLKNVLAEFGSFITEVEHQVGQGSTTNELVDKLKGVKTNNRKVKMNLKKHIPGMILVQVHGSLWRTSPNLSTMFGERVLLQR